MTLNYNNRLISIGKPLIMAILNATPDSFYSPSRGFDEGWVLSKVDQMLEDGMDVLDVGAYSSRPMAEFISEEEELRRLSLVLEPIVKRYPNLPLSVDTFRASIASAVVKNYGVGIINDIGGGTLDEHMFATIAELGIVYVLMHMRGTPKTMQELCDYSNVLVDVLSDLQQKVHQLRLFGVKDIVIDPGFGFAKTLEQNYTLLNNLQLFNQLGAPLLVGVSRKSMIYKLLNTDADQALNGTTALHMVALQQGASILRVHDVKEAVEVVKIFEQLRNNY